MEITLRKVVISAALSEETMAYTADVYLGDVKIAHARNDGGGGMTHLASRDAVGFATAQAYARANPLPYLGCPTMLAAELDEYVDVLAQHAAEVKELRRKLGRSTLFVLSGQTTLYVSSAAQEAVATKYPGAILLNRLPFEEARNHYRAYLDAHA